MKNFLPFCFLLLLSLPAVALDDGHAKYVGGTVPGVNAGVIGRLNTTSETSLIFEQAGNKIEIPYAAIESYQYSTEVSAHLGVLPAIAVRLVKRRRHSHFFRISYRGQDSAVQVVVLEVPKHMPHTLEAILQTRSPGICRTGSSSGDLSCTADVTVQKLP